MNQFKQKISQVFEEKWLMLWTWQREYTLETTFESAKEYILSQIASTSLSPEDIWLLRDMIALTPETFDMDEFLSQRVKNYSTLVDEYFEKWLTTFTNSL